MATSESSATAVEVAQGNVPAQTQDKGKQETSKAVKGGRFLIWLVMALPKLFINQTFRRGLIGFTTVLSLAFGGFLIYFFGFAVHRADPSTMWGYGSLGWFTHNRIMPNLTWIACTYIPLGILSAALNPMDLSPNKKERRIWGPIFNHATSAFPGIVMIVLFAKNLIPWSNPLLVEAALQSSVISAAEFGIGFIISLIVANARKTIGS